VWSSKTNTWYDRSLGPMNLSYVRKLTDSNLLEIPNNASTEALVFQICLTWKWRHCANPKRPLLFASSSDTAHQKIWTFGFRNVYRERFLAIFATGFLVTAVYRYVSKGAFRRLVYLTSAPITVYCTTCWENICRAICTTISCDKP